MNLRQWVTLRPNFRLRGYVLRQYLWTIRWGNGYTTTLPLEVFTQRKSVADFIQLKLNFIKNRFLSHSLEDLGVAYALHSSLESPWSTSYFTYLNFFRYLLWLRRYKRKSVKVSVFEGEWVN